MPTLNYPLPFVGGHDKKRLLAARKAKLDHLVQLWEDRLAGKSELAGVCSFCGEPLPPRQSRGPRRMYCTARCRVAASRALKDRPKWLPEYDEPRTLYRESIGEGARYVDAFPGERPQLNAPVLPREGEKADWAYDVIGQFDV